jgi:hypothetical protein
MQIESFSCNRTMKNKTYTHIYIYIHVNLRKSVNNFFIYFDCIICQFRRKNNQIIEMK